MASQNIVLRAREDGKNAARQELRQEIFDYLEGKYMHPTVERGTERAETILEITREIRELLK